MYTPQIEVWAHVTFTVAAGVVTIQSNSGKVASVTRAAAGDYTINLQANEGVDASLLGFQATALDTAARIAVLDFAGSTDTAKHLLTFSDAGAATDTGVSVVITKKRLR